MADYWIRDRKGRLLGPLSFSALEDLFKAGRIDAEVAVSQDGKLWVGFAQLPETARLIVTADAASRRAAQQEQARQVLAQLEHFRELPDPWLFGVEENASLEAYRTAFLAVVKRYHPASLPLLADASLQSAFQKMFEFLRARFLKVSERLAAEARGGRPASAAEPGPFSPAGGTFAVDEFVGWERRTEGRAEASVRITAQNVGLFTQSALVNISTGGLFIPSKQLPKMGERIDMTFSLEGSDRKVQVEARVVWQNTAETPKRPVGFGVRFDRISDEDRAFLEDSVKRMLEPPANTG